MSNVAVVSAGNYGTALAHVLSENDHLIRIHVRETDTYHVIRASHVNATYLPGIHLNENRIVATTELADAVRGMEFILLTVPSQYVRETIRALAQYLDPQAIIVLTSKGMLVEKEGMGERLVTMSEIADQELPESNSVCGLYGITFAKFIALGKGLSSMCIASVDENAAKRVAGLFTKRTSKNFRIYVSSDLRGAEFGGAMKNVYAIAMGIFDEYLDAKEDSEELGVKPSRYPLLNLCMMEFVKFGLAHKVKIHTLLGPSGIGDIEACAPLSRNYQYGRWLARVALREVAEKAPPLHEGYDTVAATMKLANEYQLDTPILRATYDILFNSKKIEEVIPPLLKNLAQVVSADEEDKLNKVLGVAVRAPKEPRMISKRRKTAFISYRFSPKGEKYMTVVKAICELQGFDVSTGFPKGPQPPKRGPSDIIIKKIKGADLYIAIFLNDRSDSTWLIEERAVAMDKNKPMLIFVEEGTPTRKRGKLYPHHPYHSFIEATFASVVIQQMQVL